MEETQKQLQPSVMKIINKLVVQFATELTLKDKRSLDAYAKDLPKSVINIGGVPMLNSDHTHNVMPQQVWVFTIMAIMKLKTKEERDLVNKYLLLNEFVKIALSGKATVKLNLSFDEYSILVKALGENL